MQRLLFLAPFFFYGAATLGQETIPTIKATSSVVDISVGDDFFVKGGWFLEPHKKPDTFSIGSKWPYEYKQVSFITDVDSISFSVQPGDTYDFIILLDETVPCHVRIVARPDPIFMNSKILISLGTGSALLAILLYLRRKKLRADHLLLSGYITPAFFWALVFTIGGVHKDYSHLRNTISELGATGTKPEAIISTSFILLAVAGMLFSFGFYKASKQLGQSSVPAILSFSQPVSLAWAAIFPLGNEFHGVIGPLPLLIALASLLVVILWKNTMGYSPLRVISLVSFFIMALILLRFVQPFGIEYEGLVQRSFYVGWSVWTIALTYFLKRGINTLNRETRLAGQAIE